MVTTTLIKAKYNYVVCDSYTISNSFKMSINFVLIDMALLRLAPIGILKYLYLPNGVPNIVSLLDSVSNLWLKKELVLSTTVNHLTPFNLCKTSSTSFALCLMA